jgi:hypothetical protein
MIDVVSHHRSLAIRKPSGKTSLRSINVDCPRSDAQNYAPPISAKVHENSGILKPLGIVHRSAQSPCLIGHDDDDQAIHARKAGRGATV